MPKNTQNRSQVLVKCYRNIQGVLFITEIELLDPFVEELEKARKEKGCEKKGEILKDILNSWYWFRQREREQIALFNARKEEMRKQMAERKVGAPT